MKRKMFYLNLIVALSLLSSGYSFADTMSTSDNQKTVTTTQQTVTVPDNTLKTQIKNAYAKDNLTANSTVVLLIQDGVVHLTGMAGSNAEVERLITIAQSVPGVRDVDTSKLTVKNSQQPLTDIFITAKVKGVLIQNRLFGEGTQVPAFQIDVETKNGMVFLTGTVENASQIQKAEELAKTIQGVKGVQSSLDIKTSTKQPSY